MTTQADIISASMSVARDVAEGRISPAELEAEAAEECRRLFATVTPDGPLWPLQVEVARGVLASGQFDPNELAEWAAVARHRVAVAESARV